MSVRAAAPLARVSEGYWRQVEKGFIQVTADLRGPVNPSDRVLRSIARTVGMDPVELLALAGREDTAEPIRSAPALDPVVAALLENTSLPAASRAHLIDQYQILLRLHQPSTDPQAAETARINRVGQALVEKLAADHPETPTPNRRTSDILGPPSLPYREPVGRMFHALLAPDARTHR